MDCQEVADLVNKKKGSKTETFWPLCHDHERSALLNFKESLVINQTASSYSSTYPKVATWKPDEKNRDCCSWDGVKCNEDTGHVVELDLASSCLYGSINSTSSLVQLVHLQRLSLFDNNFNFSKIPSEILNLSRLTHLNLSRSYFSGQIPVELLELSNLEVLDLSFSDFENFCLELQKPGLVNLAENLTNLKALNLINVDISSTVPHTLVTLSSLRRLSLDAVCKKSSSLEDLRLSYTRFSGKIPDSMENLQSLSYLDISDCSFIGKIPSSLGNLTKLENLYLSGNVFPDDLPTSIGNLASLKTLGISSFNFSGTLQASLGNLTQLDSLRISYSNFSGLMSSSLSWLTNLNQLTSLNFPYCNLNNEIPFGISNLTQLIALDLSHNQLTGPIPFGISNLTQLTALDLSHNQLTGPIPYWLMNLKKVTFLFLRFNQLTGRIPVEISDLTQLQDLQLSSNQLEGSVPSSIFELRNLEALHLSFNNLSGTVDLNMFLLSFKRLEALVLSSNKMSLLTRTTSSTNSLEYLNLSYNLLMDFEHNLRVLPWNSLGSLDLRFNKLQGPFPIPSASIFSYLISNNHLTGEIPPSICSLNGLHALDLSYNNLSGMLPECLGNFSVALSLKFVHLGNNRITDVFPSWLGTLPELGVLVLKSNNFHGEIKEPRTAFDFSKLRIIDLSHNRFGGNLPSKHFDSIILSNNSFVGEIPTSIANLKGLRNLDFSNNNLQRRIPSSLSNLTAIESMDLSSNMLSGNIPQQLSELTSLEFFDVSDNLLTGPIPRGKQFDTEFI
ncbi:Receptor-like protein 6 [Citrus sinensis]|nr:Receptor-like protein 6 [Citrus sinensis]